MGKRTKIAKKTLKIIMSVTLIFALFLSLCIAASAASSLTTYEESKTLKIEDIQWKAIPDGKGAYHIQNVATGKYLGKDGDNIGLIDTPVVWTYEIRTEDNLNNYTLYSTELGLPLRYSNSTHRFSARTPFTYVGIFERQVTGGEIRYVKVTAIKDNATYIIVGMNDDTGIPKALTNVIVDNNRSLTSVDVEILKDGSTEYVTYGEKDSSTSADKDTDTSKNTGTSEGTDTSKDTSASKDTGTSTSIPKTADSGMAALFAALTLSTAVCGILLKKRA